MMRTRSMALLGAMALVSLALAGCADDDVRLQAPPAAASFENVQPDLVSGLEHLNQLLGLDGEPAVNGAGVWPYGDYVFGSGLGGGFWIADISDPANPLLLWQTDENSTTTYGRDVDVVEHLDGRLSLVVATQSDGMHIWDVTDPTAPEFLSRIYFQYNHNVAVVPGTEFVFNSPSRGSGGSNQLVDLSDPLNPLPVGDFGSHGCHDISFWGTFGDDKFRAYCPGIDRTEIWDLSQLDPQSDDLGIRLVATIGGGDPDEVQESPVVGNPLLATYPVRTLHHLAIVNNDATILMVGDEHNGGGSPGSCFAYDPTTGTSTPLGALWFYDISNEEAPELLSWISPPAERPGPNAPQDPPAPPEDPNGGQSWANSQLRRAEPTPSCTAHFGTVVPGEEKVVMGWYYAGILTIDFSDPEAPAIIDQQKPAGDVFAWDARVHNGYVFTGDINRGMDVFQLV